MTSAEPGTKRRKVKGRSCVPGAGSNKRRDLSAQGVPVNKGDRFWTRIGGAATQVTVDDDPCVVGPEGWECPVSMKFNGRTIVKWIRTAELHDRPPSEALF